MINKIRRFIEEYHMLGQGEHVIAGVSGGADSVCLFFVLLAVREQYQLRLTVVHVEHGIRGKESRQDAAFVEKLCADYGVVCIVRACDVPAFCKKEKLSLEEGARKLRYQIFEAEKKALGADRIAVAHNQNDAAETLLFHMIRGSGLRGMCGIEPVRGDLIRPLLCVNRTEIEAYLKEINQIYRVDATNFDPAYSRNRLRHQVIPVLTEINGQAVAHLSRSTRYAAEACELVEELTERAECHVKRRRGDAFLQKSGIRQQGECRPDAELLQHGERRPDPELLQHGECLPEAELLQDGEILLLETIEKEPALIRKTLVHHLLCELAGASKDLGEVHVCKSLELFDRQTGNVIDLPYGIRARRTYEGVVFAGRGASVPGQEKKREKTGWKTGQETGQETEKKARERAEETAGSKMMQVPLVPGTREITWDGTVTKIRARVLERSPEQEIPKKRYTKWFDYDKIKGTLLWRGRSPGDYLVINDRGGRQSIKKYLINEKVPQSRREHILLLADGVHILWVVGGRISEAVKVTEETKNILEVQVYGGNEDE